MAKARVSTNPKYTGGAGGYSFYVRSGEQIVRQRKNNSNYGETASRTYAQMVRRVKWSNLVNCYKAMRFWIPKAFELRKQGQTDYNRFMQLNIPFCNYALTKQQALAGACAIENYKVSEGTLKPITFNDQASTPFESDIAIATSFDNTATVADVSASIINNNKGIWQNGDNLVLVWFDVDGVDGNPFMRCEYLEFTLDLSATTIKWEDHPMNGQFAHTSGYITIPQSLMPTRHYGFVLIHTRKVGGKLQVSSQESITPTDQWEDLYTPAHIQEAIMSYGLDQTVMLDPGVQSVTNSVSRSSSKSSSQSGSQSSSQSSSKSSSK